MYAPLMSMVQQKLGFYKDVSVCNSVNVIRERERELVHSKHMSDVPSVLSFVNFNVGLGGFRTDVRTGH